MTLAIENEPGGETAAGPSFAVAFGGGGARGFAHIHVIEALDELGIRPTAIAGSSIGALMGAAMAAGMRGSDIRAHVLATLGDRGAVASRVWRMRPASFSEMLQGGVRFTQFSVERILKAFLPEGFPAIFEELEIPLTIIATDFYGQCEIALESGDLMSAIAASAAIPALFRPVRRGERILIDGGIYNPIPFDHLRGKADLVIGVDVVGAPTGNPGRMPSAIDSIFGATQLMMQSIISMKLKSDGPAIMIRPPVSDFRVLDFLGARRIIEATEGVRDDVKRAVDAAIAFADDQK